MLRFWRHYEDQMSAAEQFGSAETSSHQEETRSSVLTELRCESVQMYQNHHGKLVKLLLY